MDQRVSTQWLEDSLGAEDLVVLDCTVFLTMTDDGYESESGRANWAQGHIPDAGFADLNEDLVDATSDNRYAVPSPQHFAEAMEALGVSDGSRVVLYDGNRMMWAARVWWMLRWIGFDNAALLDGGLKAWKAEGRPLSVDRPNPASGSLTVTERPGLIADKADVLAALEDGGSCLVDALPSAIFTGKANVYGRAGHIPSATNTSAADLTTESGHLLAVDELKGRFDADPSRRVVNYCGGGIAASLTAYVQTMLGFDDVAVYTASLQEWVRDPDAPMTTA